MITKIKKKISTACKIKYISTFYLGKIVIKLKYEIFKLFFFWVTLGTYYI